LITSFRKLGAEKLNGLSPADRKLEFLKFQTIVPKTIPEKTFYEIILNLNTSTNEIEIKLGKELSEENRFDFMGFEIPVKGNPKKIYFTTNQLRYLDITVPQMIEKIEKDFKKSKEYDEFKKYLLNIKDTFCTEKIRIDKGKEKKYCGLNLKKLQNDIKLEIGKEQISMNDVEEYCKKVQTENYPDLKSSKKSELKTYVNIYSLKIDGKSILETGFKEDYVNIIDYTLKERYFDKVELKKGICGICGTESDITGKIDIPLSFYITDNKYFFENLTEKNKHKSFSICKNCFEELRIGISEIQKNFGGQVAKGISYYIIPKNNYSDPNFKKVCKKINDKLQGTSSSVNGKFNEIRDIKRVEYKNEDFVLDYLFYTQDKAKFTVLENITDVSYSRMEFIFDELKRLTNEELYSKLIEVGFNHVYVLLFPNKLSHTKVDSKLYQKEFLSLFSSMINGRAINYDKILRNFNYIFKKFYFNTDKKDDRRLRERHIQMNILLTWFNKISGFTGGFDNMVDTSAIPIENKDILEFFRIHEDIYSNNTYRQGLFLLGYLINKILLEQNDKSGNFMNKINFDGIPSKRVHRLILDVTEYLSIYKIYSENNGVYSQMVDRLQGIDTSELKGDEIVFYVLSGVSFGRYLGHKYYMEKKGGNNE